MKTFRLIGATAMAVMMSMCFVACDDDDDDDYQNGNNSGSGSSSSTVIASESKGSTLSAMANGSSASYFHYDDDNRFVDFVDEVGDGYSVTYDPFVLVEHYNSANAETFTGTLTSEGYIATLEKTETNYSGTETETETSEMTYDIDGHLTNVVNVEVETKLINGVAVTTTETQTTTLTWENGNLVQIYMLSVESDGSWEDETFTITYGNIENVYKQYTYALADCLDFMVEEEFVMGSGLLGIGTNYLPSTITESEREGYNYGTSSQTTYQDGAAERKTYTYTLYSNGTIANEKENGSIIYSYTYTDLTGTM